jgi:hypothetical protein
MVASYEEFAAQQRAEHLNPFNRWYLLALPAAATAVLGKPKAGAALFALSQAVIVAGHIPEGNVLEQTRITARHPIWALRADIAVANATIIGALRS